MTHAGGNRVARRSHPATEYLRAAIIVFALVSVALCVPAVHMALGITGVDALDQGMVVPQAVSSTTVAPLIGLLVVVVFAARGVSFRSLHGNVAFASSAVSLRPVAVRQHARLPHTARSSLGADADVRRTLMNATPTLRQAHVSAQPEGSFVRSLRTSISGEEGCPTH